MKLTNDMLERLGAAYALGEAAQTRRMKVSGMTFDIAAYKVEGLGHVSVMIASGFFGLMKMDTLIITPTAVDMPLFSYDRVLAMGNDTLIFELYDTLLDKADLTALEQVKAGDVLVEYDKLIDQQLERAAITAISGFAKICDGASAVLNV